jgi:hypothetical protein
VLNSKGKGLPNQRITLTFLSSEMKIYRGKSNGGRRIVTVNGKPLAPRYASNDRRNVPFDWGIESPGTRHLAEALLADCAGARTPRFLAHEFASQVVSKLPLSWEFRADEIEKWLRLRATVGRSAQQAAQRAIWGHSAFAEAAPSPVPLRPGDFPSFPVDPVKQNPDWLYSLRERIRPDELAKQGFPRPKDVQLSRSADSTGEDAFYVYLVFSDKTPEKALAWERVEPMVSWVRNLIWTETGARLWPYVKVKRQKELAACSPWL